MIKNISSEPGPLFNVFSFHEKIELVLVAGGIVLIEYMIGAPVTNLLFI